MAAYIYLVTLGMLIALSCSTDTVTADVASIPISAGYQYPPPSCQPGFPGSSVCEPIIISPVPAPLPLPAFTSEPLTSASQSSSTTPVTPTSESTTAVESLATTLDDGAGTKQPESIKPTSAPSVRTSTTQSSNTQNLYLPPKPIEEAFWRQHIQQQQYSNHLAALQARLNQEQLLLERQREQLLQKQAQLQKQDRQQQLLRQQILLEQQRQQQLEVDRRPLTKPWPVVPSGGYQTITAQIPIAPAPSVNYVSPTPNRTPNAALVPTLNAYSYKPPSALPVTTYQSPAPAVALVPAPPRSSLPAPSITYIQPSSKPSVSRIPASSSSAWGSNDYSVVASAEVPAGQPGVLAFVVGPSGSVSSLTSPAFNSGHNQPRPAPVRHGDARLSDAIVVDNPTLPAPSPILPAPSPILTGPYPAARSQSFRVPFST